MKHDDPRSHLNLSDDELDSALNRKERERERARERLRPFRSDAHAGVDASVEGAKSMVSAILGDNLLDLARPVMLPLIPPVGDAWVLANDPQIAASWHEAVDRSPADLWHDVDRDEHTARLAAIDADIGALKREKRLRALAEARSKLEAEERAINA